MNFRALAVNHKAIGGHYLVAGLLSFLLGIVLTQILRARLSSSLDDMQPNGFNAYLGATHGTIQVFFGIVPVVFCAFGNYLMPLGRETKMALPRLNLIGVILFYLSIIFMLVQNCPVKSLGMTTG